MTLQQTHFEVKEGPWYTKSCIFYERTYLLSAHVILQGQNLPDIITIASFKKNSYFWMGYERPDSIFKEWSGYPLYDQENFPQKNPSFSRLVFTGFQTHFR